MEQNKRQIGSRYEEQAAAYLEKQGMVIQEKNYRCRIGEIDLIGVDRGTLCFIEVKYRSSSREGMPYEAVNRRKQQTIYRVAQVYLKQHGIRFTQPCRFDVVSILGEDIRWYPNAFGSF